MTEGNPEACAGPVLPERHLFLARPLEEEVHEADEKAQGSAGPEFPEDAEPGVANRENHRGSEHESHGDGDAGEDRDSALRHHRLQAAVDVDRDRRIEGCRVVDPREHPREGLRGLLRRELDIRTELAEDERREFLELRRVEGDRGSRPPDRLHALVRKPEKERRVLGRWERAGQLGRRLARGEQRAIELRGGEEGEIDLPTELPERSP
jgi:hypothetical protein